MKILLLFIGKTDQPFLDEGMRLYFTRIERYLPFEFKVIPDLKNRKHLLEAEQKEAEARLIEAQLQAGDVLVLLDENGKNYHSRGFAAFLEQQMLQSVKRLVFVIGGPYGFTDKLKQQARFLISLSPMTFSHQLVRLVFAEQLYRAFSILKGEPYHHD